MPFLLLRHSTKCSVHLKDRTAFAFAKVKHLICSVDSIVIREFYLQFY